jgi:predicted SnoaL-like aldol condensation-catalyzing enzyme
MERFLAASTINLEGKPMAARKSKGKSRNPVAKRKSAKKKVARKTARKTGAKSAGKSAKRPVRRAVAKRPLDTLAAERARLEANKQLVLAFYRKMIGDKDPDAARPYMAEQYVQHSAYARDGFEGVAEFARTFKRDFPNHRYEVKKVIAEGDFVVLHLHGINGMSPHGEQVVDMFRVKNGRVCEHWDVIQPIPGDSSNPNGTF